MSKVCSTSLYQNIVSTIFIINLFKNVILTGASNSQIFIIDPLSDLTLCCLYNYFIVIFMAVLSFYFKYFMYFFI